METNMEVKYNINNEDAVLHLSMGNTKLGKTILNFATLPGNDVHRPQITDKDTNEKVLLSNVDGTCSKYCDNCAKNGACYAWKMLCLHHNVVTKAWADNTILLREGKVFDMIDDELNNNSAYSSIKLFRINVSGEIENLTQLEGWNDLAKKHPKIQFSLYTKNFDVLEEFILKHGDTNKNFVINVSQWNHVADEFLKKYPNKFNVFEYDGSIRKSDEYLEEDIKRLANEKHCPAVLKNGKHFKKNGVDFTCDMCKKCYKKTGKLTAVYAH